MLVGYDKDKQEIYADEELEEKVREYFDYYFEDFLKDFWDSKSASEIWVLLKEETQEQIMANAREKFLKNCLLQKIYKNS